VSKPKESKNMLVGLDIGTSKIVAMVAEVLMTASSTSSAWARPRHVV
jgi:cell division ATPase FtsA